ncbi:MAG: hypothetical protein AB7S65_06040 [Sulfuricurvum sp.]
MYNGLSLDQAPPISAVMRFFLSVPVFGLILSCIAILSPDALLTPSHPLSLAAIHLMFLGVLTMSMIGALFQMQSVLGGRPIPSPAGNGWIIHLLLALGVIALSAAFAWQQSIGFVIASVLLGSALVYTAFLVLPLLFGGVIHDTLRGMRLALVSLLITALLGIVMASAYANASFSEQHAQLREIHYSFGLAGWVATLIIAVAFQVVEMFYVTTGYNEWCKRNAFRIIAAALGLKALFLLAGWGMEWIFDAVFAALMIGFVATTLRRLKERKRKVPDVSIAFWQAGIALLSLFVLSHSVFLVSGLVAAETAALIAFALFALSIILGMLTKIVPFLVWFHLNSAGYMETPIMSHIIPAPRNTLLLRIFLGATAIALFSAAYPPLMRVSGVAFAAVFALLGYNLIRALILYRRVVRTGTRFEFPSA